MADGEQTLKRVFVGNLAEGVTKADVDAEFSKFGTVTSIWMAVQPSGFAFVDYETRAEAEKACSALNGTEMFGSKSVSVKLIEPQTSEG